VFHYKESFIGFVYGVEFYVVKSAKSIVDCRKTKVGEAVTIGLRTLYTFPLQPDLRCIVIHELYTDGFDTSFWWGPAFTQCMQMGPTQCVF
jgi:hypothetical protein